MTSQMKTMESSQQNSTVDYGQPNGKEFQTNFFAKIPPKRLLKI